MPVPLLVLPALVAFQAQAPNPATASIDRMQELFEAVPEAYIAGKRGELRRRVGAALAGWERDKGALARLVPEAELTAMDRQLKAMKGMKPREQAVGALGLMGILGQHQAKGRALDLLTADRTLMLAWCSADAGQVERFPGVPESLKALIEADQGRHPLVVAKIREGLTRLEAAQTLKQKGASKKVLADLLQLVDALEKP